MAIPYDGVAGSSPALAVKWRAWRWMFPVRWLMFARMEQHVTVGAVTGTARDDAQGDRAVLSFEGFVREHEYRVLNYLWRMTGNEQTAYDLTQETFVRAWQRFETVRQHESPRAWLFRVATNLAISHHRRAVKPVGAAVPLEDEHDVPSASDPARRLVESDAVRRILLQLSPKRRGALILREIYGLDTEEIAQTLGMKASAVRVALYRARDQFRELYLREGGDR